MYNYSQNQAKAAFKNQNAPTYINVWTWITYPTNILDREIAKANVIKFAKENNMTVSELFEEYKNSLDAVVCEKSLEGHFDF